MAPVMWMAEGITSQPYSTPPSSMPDAGPPGRITVRARAFLASRSYTADSRAPVPQAKSATRSVPMAAASAQSTPSSLARPGPAGLPGRQGVEGGEVLAVRNQALEDAAGQVVGLVYAGGADRLRRSRAGGAG